MPIRPSSATLTSKLLNIFYLHIKHFRAKLHFTSLSIICLDWSVLVTDLLAMTLGISCNIYDMLLKEVNICPYHNCIFSASAVTAGCPPRSVCPSDPLAGSKGSPSWYFPQAQLMLPKGKTQGRKINFLFHTSLQPSQALTATFHVSLHHPSPDSTNPFKSKHPPIPVESLRHWVGFKILFCGEPEESRSPLCFRLAFQAFLQLTST